jgi:hypothetical protein
MFALVPLLFLGHTSDSTARFQSWNPDLTLSFQLPKDNRFVQSPAKLDGSLMLIQDRIHRGSVILVSFEKGAELSKRIEAGHSELLRLIPNKRVEPLESSNLKSSFGLSGLKFSSFSYPSGPRTSVGGSICDAAAAYWQTAGGVWTVSVNGDLGNKDGIQKILEDFISSSNLSDMSKLAVVKS